MMCLSIIFMVMFLMFYDELKHFYKFSIQLFFADLIFFHTFCDFHIDSNVSVDHAQRLRMIHRLGYNVVIRYR